MGCIGLDTEFAQLDRCRQPCRTGPDDQDVHLPGGYFSGSRQAVVGRQFRQAGHALHRHSLVQRGHAGLDGKFVGDDHTLGALAVGAKKALGAVVFGVMPEDMNSGGKKC